MDEVRGPQRPAKRARFRRYIDQVNVTAAGDADGDRGYDLIQVDGKARLECVAAALPRLAPDGRLVVDDVDKPGRFRDLRQLLPTATWSVRRTWGPGPASAWRLVTSAAVAQRW